MVLKLVSAAVLAVAAGLGAANAQSAGDLRGPQEVPPASFSGQQFVDSRGCVFLRAGLAGRTNWVPRVSRNRTQLCGYPPTFGNNQVAVAEMEAPPVAAARPAPAPHTPSATGSRRPMETVASTTAPPRIRQAPPPVRQRVAAETYAPPPVVQGTAPRVVVRRPEAAPVAPPAVVAAPVVAAPAATRRQLAERVASPTGNRRIGCYSDAPVAERFALQGGGSVVLCTKGDGDVANGRAPRLLAGQAAVAPSGYLEGPDPAGRVAKAATARKQPAAPAGYRQAHGDDRLNPDRAKGTAQGWADQDGVWTREVPARLVADAVQAQGKKVVVRRTHLSTKSEPASARSYVQVGTFGESANAERASARLAGLGLPVARSNTVKGGRSLQIVMAGPFGSAAEAQAALRAARGAGFGDAYLR